MVALLWEIRTGLWPWSCVYLFGFNWNKGLGLNVHAKGVDINQVICFNISGAVVNTGLKTNMFVFGIAYYCASFIVKVSVFDHD